MPESVVEHAAPESRAPELARTSEPERAPERAAPIVAWRAPTPMVSETAASTNGDGIPPAPSDDARYDDIWTAAFAPPQQTDEPHAVEPQASEPDGAKLEAQAPEAQAPEAAEPREPEPREPEPQSSEPGRTTESAPAPAAAAVPAAEVADEDRPAPPEDEVSAEDDMWSLRARLAEAAARKHPPHGDT
jgi:hypothetical protein